MAGVEATRENIRLAASRLSDLIYQTSSRSWRLAIERVGDEQERRIVGVESPNGTMVMGDCMSDVNNEVAIGDAEYITVLDPDVAFYLCAVLEGAADSAPNGSPLLANASAAAFEINRKWTAMRKAQGE
jgi:hypothetical protein